MRIVGFDPGSRGFGIGIVDAQAGRVTCIHSSTVRLPEGQDFHSRMRILHERLNEVLDRYPVDESAMEEGFLGKNVRSMAMVATVRGLVMGILIGRSIPLTLYSPRLVKQALTGYGQADKSQIARMVARLLAIDATPLSPDETDALAVAYCHAQLRR
jgi:crossover junction endodeoxyribonuclease RuvC